MQRDDIYVPDEDARKLDYIRSQLTPTGLAKRNAARNVVGGTDPLHEALGPILKRYSRPQKTEEVNAA